MTDHTIGVDISKSHLDVFRLEDGATQRFENSAVGFRDRKCSSGPKTLELQASSDDFDVR